MTTITDSAKMNFPQEERSDRAIANAVKDWLKLATARISKKK